MVRIRCFEALCPRCKVDDIHVSHRMSVDPVGACTGGDRLLIRAGTQTDASYGVRSDDWIYIYVLV
jgi:hypothetical protein